MNNTAEYMREFREKKRKELEAYREKHCIEIPVPAGQRKVYVDVGEDKAEAEKALPEMMNAIALKILHEEEHKANKEKKDEKTKNNKENN